MSTAHWLALSTLPGIGGATARKLLERFGDIQSVFSASAEELATIPRVTPALAAQLLAAPVSELEAEVLSLNDEGIDVLTWDDDRFPEMLRPLADVPLVLFVCGSIGPEDARAVAIVGSRQPGAQSQALARKLGYELAIRGLTVVSGLALGVDAAAHWGAVESDGGRTLAVLGSGIRVIHPRENAELAERIVSCGALLSELHPNTPPRGPQLMARDRIVSGLSRALIVVEAGEKSGSLDTAARARKQGRAVYAVPGSAGTDGLLQDGARRLDPETIDYDTLAGAIAGEIELGENSSEPRQVQLW